METEKPKESAEISKIIKDIIKGIDSGNTVVFCGAGISRESGLPVVNQLVPYILDKLEIPEDDKKLILDQNDNPRIPFEAFVEVLRDNSDVNKIFDIYKQGEPNTNHLLLAKLIKTGKLKTIVTTNFDKLIEKALALDPNPWIEGNHFDVVYLEEDFEKINWKDKRIRIIKIHGSVDDTQRMAMTLKRVASQILSGPRMSVIKHIFSTGNHDNVIILGYSASDIFDISPQIQSIDEEFKKVYYVQHSDSTQIEKIDLQLNNNPFKKFKESKRLFIKTKQLVKDIWDAIINSSDQYILKSSETDWKVDIDDWYLNIINDYSESIKYGIPAIILNQLGNHTKALNYSKEAFESARLRNDELCESLWLGTHGAICFYSGDFISSINCTMESLKISQKTGDKSSKYRSLINLANTYISLGELNKAKSYFKKALKLSLKSKDFIGTCMCYGGLGNVYGSMAKFNKAFQYYEKAMNSAISIGDKQCECTSLGNIGIIYESIGEFNQALIALNKAVKIAQDIGSQNSISRWYGSIGRVYRSLGEFHKAIDFFKEAYRISVDGGALNSQGTWLGNLGNVHLSIGKYEEAIKYYEESLTIARNTKDKHGEGARLGNLGTLYLNIQDFERAEENLKEAIKITQEINDKQNEGSYLGNLGHLYFKTGKINGAIKHFEKALRIAQEIGDIQSEGLWIGNLGNIHLSRNEFPKAMTNFRIALKISKKIHDKHNQGLWLTNIGTVYLNIGDFKNAISFFKQAISIITDFGGPNHPYVKQFDDYLQMAKQMLIK
jgi:tetratricopeptide (TPR) repeat protein